MAVHLVLQVADAIVTYDVVRSASAGPLTAPRLAASRVVLSADGTVTWVGRRGRGATDQATGRENVQALGAILATLWRPQATSRPIPEDELFQGDATIDGPAPYTCIVDRRLGNWIVAMLSPSGPVTVSDARARLARAVPIADAFEPVDVAWMLREAFVTPRLVRELEAAYAVERDRSLVIEPREPEQLNPDHVATVEATTDLTDATIPFEIELTQATAGAESTSPIELESLQEIPCPTPRRRATAARPSITWRWQRLVVGANVGQCLAALSVGVGALTIALGFVLTALLMR